MEPPAPPMDDHLAQLPGVEPCPLLQADLASQVKLMYQFNNVGLFLQESILLLKCQGPKRIVLIATFSPSKLIVSYSVMLAAV